jgi:hypothetical protein
MTLHTTNAQSVWAQRASTNIRAFGAGRLAPFALLFAAPLLMAQSSTAPRTPFQQQVTMSISTGAAGGFSSVPVPVGKRLIVEYVSLSGTVPTGQKLSAALQTTVGDSTAIYSIVTAIDETSEGTDKLAANQMMRVYAEGPMLHVVCWRAKTEGQAQITLNISGYLEPLQ